MGTSYGGGDDLSSHVIDIVPNNLAFAAIKRDDEGVQTAAAWGDPMYGGDRSWTQQMYSHGVEKIIPGNHAFVGLVDRENFGVVFAWGHPLQGGMIQYGSMGFIDRVVTNQKVNTADEGGAFAAIGRSGGVKVWGNPQSGGYLTPEQQRQLYSGVVDVFSTPNSFVALKDNGQVVAWGEGTGANIGDAEEALKPQDIIVESNL